MTLTTRLAIAMSLLVAVAVSAVGWLSYRSLEMLLPRVLDRIEAHSRLIAFDLLSYVGSARGDIASFRSAAALNGLIRARQAGGIDPVDGLSEQTWRARITGHLLAELEAKPAYAQFRIIGIDNGGREIVRVDRSGPGGAVRQVPDAELQQKGDRPYFSDTIALPANEVYVSPLDLNQENGVIETPHVPIIRVATRLPGSDGKPFGIIIINVDMRPAFDRVRSSMRQGEGIYVVNRRGDYLVNPDPTREFGSELRTPANWRADFPDLSASIGATQSVSHIVTDQAGRPSAVALAPALLAGKEWLGIIETIPNAVLVAPAMAIRQTTMLVGLIAVLFAAALAVLVARSLTGPIRGLTAAVEDAGRGNPISIPVGARGETGVLARAFARVIDEANAKTTALEREVMDHRRTEAARDHYAARERIFSAAVESSSDSVVTYALDGVITGWNPAAERLYGYAAAEAVGRNIDSLVPPERLDETRDILRRTARGEAVEPFETVRRRKDGSAIEISLAASPIMVASGTIIGASTTARDISESRRTQHALRQQIEERRRVFETSQDLILVTDPKGVLVQVSPSSLTILGYAPEQMIGHSAIDFIFGDDLDNTRAEMRAARPKYPELRFALRPQRWANRDAVVDGGLVRAGQAAFLHRPRHDRKPAGAGSIARKRADGARHHR